MRLFLRQTRQYQRTIFTALQKMLVLSQSIYNLDEILRDYYNKVITLDEAIEQIYLNISEAGLRDTSIQIVICKKIIENEECFEIGESIPLK